MSSTTKITKTKQKVKMPTERKSKYEVSHDRFFNCLFILLISVFLIVVPFYRGLYFRENYIPSIIFISGVFILYILYILTRKDHKLINSYLDIAVLLLPAVYLISFLFSVNAKDAFDAVLKYSAYFMIYKITSDLCRNAAYKKAAEYVIVTAMFVMAAAGLVCALGYLDLNGVIMYKRIYGLYQYSNATASAMGAAIFLTLGFSLNCSKMSEKVFFNLVLATAFPAFILTFSRGAYVIFALLVVLNVILLDARKRVQYIYGMLTLIASNGMFLLKYYGSDNVSDSTIYLVGGIILFLALQLLYEKVLSKPIDRISIKAVNVLLLSLFAASAIAVFALISIKAPIEYRIEHVSGEESSWKSKDLQVKEVLPDKEYTVQFYVKSNIKSKYSQGVVVYSINDSGEENEIVNQSAPVGNEFELISHKFNTNVDTISIVLRIYNYEENSYTVYKDIQVIDSKGSIVKKFDKIKYLPEALADRLADISLRTQSVSSRAYFLKDGMRIIKDNFLIGTGGGGWKNLYRKYQSLPYDSAEAHNFYLQYAIETGIIGIAVLLSIYYLFIIKGFTSLLKNKEYEKLPLYIALIMMMVHAFMDFDLSLTALAFLFWMMIGIVGSEDKELKGKALNKSYIKIGLLISTIAIIYFSSSVYMGMLRGKEAVSLIDKDINRSISLYESAMKRDPYNSNYYMDYMQVMLSKYKSSQDISDLDKFQNCMDKVLEMGVYDAKQGSVIVNLLLSTGNLDKAMQTVNEMLDNNPMLANLYMHKININYEIAKHYFSNKKHKKAIPYLNNMLEAEVQFNAANSRAAEPMKTPEKMSGMVGLARNWLDIAEKRN